MDKNQELSFKLDSNENKEEKDNSSAHLELRVNPTIKLIGGKRRIHVPTLEIKYKDLKPGKYRVMCNLANDELYSFSPMIFMTSLGSETGGRLSLCHESKECTDTTTVAIKPGIKTLYKINVKIVDEKGELAKLADDAYTSILLKIV